MPLELSRHEALRGICSRYFPAFVASGCPDRGAWGLAPNARRPGPKEVGPPRKLGREPRCSSVGHYEHRRAGYTLTYTMQGGLGTPSPMLCKGFLTIRLPISNSS